MSHWMEGLGGYYWHRFPWSGPDYFCGFWLIPLAQPQNYL